MDPGRQRAEVELLSGSGFEFPSTNYRRVNGGDYRFVWGAADGPRRDGGYASSIVKVDVRTGTSSAFADGERVYGEPVFVARPGARAEDDGYLLSLVYDAGEDLSYVAIFDAVRLAEGPLARVWLGHHVPFTFHGLWIPG